MLSYQSLFEQCQEVLRLRLSLTSLYGRPQEVVVRYIIVRVP